MITVSRFHLTTDDEYQNAPFHQASMAFGHQSQNVAALYPSPELGGGGRTHRQILKLSSPFEY